MFLPKTIICNRYELQEILSRGGMGEVWLAKDIILERIVAIKSIDLKLLDEGEGLISIFKDEAIIGASLLGHPNIVSILDYGIYDNDSSKQHFIVMEYVDGLPVSKFIEKIRFEVDEATYYYISLLIAWETCGAIQYAHKKGVLHRDIKPLNIFLSKYGVVKVGDFGLARFIDAATRTHTVGSYNSPAYAAPEQWKGENHQNFTDIYQLGCTLYQIFTGQLVFNKNTMALMNSHLSEKPTPPIETCKKMSEKLSDILLKMLSKKGNERAALWELNDILAEELQKTFSLRVRCDKNDEEKITKIFEITEFSKERLKEDGEAVFPFPDFNEVLSEALELISNNIFSFSIEEK